MNVIFQINGGIGKVITSTAVCVSIKAKYPDAKVDTTNQSEEECLLYIVNNLN